MSTRRSARTTTQTPVPAATSSSSLSSRGIRGQTKDDSPASSESADAAPNEPRRSRRQNTDSDPPGGSNDPNDEVIDDGDGEEVTRCICGQQEYPGPPLNELFDGVDHSSEEIGGFFLACDQCSVWMHGGCVGIVEESQSPEKYYCEQCKPKFHDNRTDSGGQKYSLYLPLHQKSHRKSSISKHHDDRSKKEKERPEPSRNSVDSSAGRRRNTMKSKQIYDEEEQLRMALEESKGDVDESSTSTRKGKRSRDESEEIKQENKRQRTASESLPGPPVAGPTMANADSEDDDDERGTTTASRAKKVRADAVQTARQIELRELEVERERARAEAAGRRQQRAGRRRADESDSIEDTPKPSEGRDPTPPPSSQPPSPPAVVQPAIRKGPGKKTKRLGTNQYTKNRDLIQPNITSSPHRRKGLVKEAQGASSSDEPLINGESHQTNTSNSTTKTSPGIITEQVGIKGKLGRGKGKAVNGNGIRHTAAEEERTIVNMSKTLDGMMAFIAKTQVEMAGEKMPASGNAANQLDVGLVLQGVPELPGHPFEELSSREMMDVMTRGITQWQAQYG